MRKVTFAIFALAALGIGSFAGTAPASARDYPWCAQGKGYGYPGECAYQTLEQCQASVSGRLLSCGVNPMVAFNQPRRQQRNYAPY